MGRYSKKHLAEMVYSDDPDLRMKAARNGYGLDVLVGDTHSGVRAAVAKQGYGLETLINDDYFWVRVCVAEQGYGLDKLIHDDSWMVRAAVADQGYGLESLVNDQNACVRGAVARQGYGLDVLINDPNFGVRQCVARQGYGLDKLKNDPDKRVRMVVKDVLKVSAGRKRSIPQNKTEKELSPVSDYSKFSTADLVKMEAAAYAEYYKLATNPRTNPSKKDLEPLEKATAKWEAISEELSSRKQSLNDQIQSASARSNSSSVVPSAKEKEPVCER